MPRLTLMPLLSFSSLACEHKIIRRNFSFGVLLNEKYRTDTVLGFLAVKDGLDIGAAIVGVKAYATVEGVNGIGVNGSGWILEQHRGCGYSGMFAAHVMSETLRRITNCDYADWYGKALWTSIDRKNLASIATAEKSGLQNVGVAANNPARNIYLLQSNFSEQA